MSAERDPERDQQLPEANDSVPIQMQVMGDLHERMEFGARKYGTPLQANNGRNALQDAYEEVLDLACYLKQRLVEEEDVAPLGAVRVGYTNEDNGVWLFCDACQTHQRPDESEWFWMPSVPDVVAAAEAHAQTCKGRDQ